MTVLLKKRVLLTKEEIDKILCSLYLFILIFAPPLIPYPHLFLTVFSFLILATTYKRTVWTVLKRSGIYKWVLVMALLAMYTVCVPLPVSMFCGDIVNTSHYISIINRYGVLIVAVSVCVTYLLCKTDRDGYGYEFLIESLINAGLIEGICAALAFLFPPVKSFFIFFMKQFSESYLYSNRTILWVCFYASGCLWVGYRNNCRYMFFLWSCQEKNIYNKIYNNCNCDITEFKNGIDYLCSGNCAINDFCA